MTVKNDSYAEVMDAFSSNEFWANRCLRSAVYAEMLPFFQLHTSRFDLSSERACLSHI